jgi:hypothetical protein
MSLDAPFRQKPGRKSIVAAHPHRDAIEAACAAGVSFRRIADQFGVGIMAVHRHWHGLTPGYRAALAAHVSNLDDVRWREVTANLAAIARRHPDARADLNALVQRISLPMTPFTMGGHANAA